MRRTLIVARLDSADAGHVAELFAESDRTELPRLIGVSHRTLLSFHDLYFHLIESEQPVGPQIRRHSAHPLFADLSAKLSSYICPYDPAWSGPQDAIAAPFYHWPNE